MAPRETGWKEDRHKLVTRRRQLDRKNIYNRHLDLYLEFIYFKKISTGRTTTIKNRTRYRGRPASLAIFTVCLATILSMNFSNLASTPFGRGRGSWPTSSTLLGTPHFSAFRDLSAPIKLPKFYDDDGLLWFEVAKAVFNFRGLRDDNSKCELL